MTHQTVIIRLPPEIHQRLAALTAEGILGRTLEEVIIHLTRNALHRDWVLRPETPERQRPSMRARTSTAPRGRLVRRQTRGTRQESVYSACRMSLT